MHRFLLWARQQLPVGRPEGQAGVWLLTDLFCWFPWFRSSGFGSLKLGTSEYTMQNLWIQNAYFNAAMQYQKIYNIPLTIRYKISNHNFSFSINYNTKTLFSKGATRWILKKKVYNGILGMCKIYTIDCIVLYTWNQHVIDQVML